MPLITLPAAALTALAAWLVFRDDDDDDDTGMPEITPQARAALIEVRIVNGQPVQYFVPAFRQSILQMLASSTLQTSIVPVNMTGAAVFQVVPTQPGAPVAQAAVLEAQSKGLAVLGTLSLPLPMRPGRFVAMTGPMQRYIAAEGTAWAVLLHPAGVPMPQLVSPPGGPPGMVVEPPPPGKTDGLDAHMPASVKAEVTRMLSDPDVDPWALDDAADALGAYPIAAERLHARATELRTVQKLQDTKKGGSEWVIRQGDIPYKMAEYYTGSSNKWRDIPKVNPGMSIQKINGVTQLVPWYGTILLPLSWKVWSKRPPPTLPGGPPKKKQPDMSETEKLGKEIVIAAKGLGEGLKTPGSKMLAWLE